MQGNPTGFWGKLKQDSEDRVLEWHPLVDHCADVAACCEAILQTTLIRKRLARLGGLADLSPVQVARLSVLAALHDIGKFNIGFQNKALPDARLKCSHVQEVLALFGDDGYDATDRLLKALPMAALQSWAPGEASIRLLVASISHHGRPVPAGGKLEAQAWKPARGLDPFAGIAGLAAQALAWFPEASANGAEPLPEQTAFQHAFSGLVMLADWLGSDRERFFPFSDEGSSDRMSFARDRALEAVRWIGLDTAGPRGSLGTMVPGFGKVSKHPPRPSQQAVIELPLAKLGGMTVLEAETGSGKTEAALMHYLRLFHAGLVDGMYFALPTRTAATQIYRRVVDARDRAFPDKSAQPPVVLAVPGYISVDDHTARRLPGFLVLWNDQVRERFRYRGWAAEHPKRFMAGSIVVGTVDQVLLSALMVGHAHMRSTALLRHLLVVDEVHASDAYMTRILEDVLRHHLAAGGQALLMSATLGAAARHRLLATSGGRRQLPAFEAACNAPYPAITTQPVGAASEMIGVASVDLDKRVGVRLEPWMDSPELMARQALKAAAAGARVLILRNTVSGCMATQQALELAASALGRPELLWTCTGIQAPHHSRFAKEDREELDEAIERSFGKDSASVGCVAAATQTVQQSLDLDADLMLTDLCPMDVLLQRFGRLFRHADRRRPPGFESAAAIVLIPVERDLQPLIQKGGEAFGKHGLGSVYDDLRILEATWRALEAESVLAIPSMNRRLVEQTTHPEALAAVTKDRGPRWREHEQWVLGTSSANRRLADLNLVDRNIAFGEAAFPSKDLARRIQTRLGEDDRLAEFESAVAGPFGKPVRVLTIPGHQAQGIPADARPTLLRADSAALEFRLGERSYHYDRLGLRPLEAP